MRTLLLPFFLFLLTGCSCRIQEKMNDEPGRLPDLSEERYPIKEVMRDGKGNFDPWNRERWSDWYNDKGEISRRFDIDTSVRFMKKEEPWVLAFSDPYEEDSRMKVLFAIASQGISVDGNGIMLDARTEEHKLLLEELYVLRKEAWGQALDKIGIFYKLPHQEGTGPTRISGFTFMGLKRGIKINDSGEEEGHLLIIDNCQFLRNKIGFYTNGHNTRVQNCRFIENGYGGIYSGSGSRGNQVIDNSFRDNCLSQHQHSYGDFIGDTFYDSEISGNEFLAPDIISKVRRIGISIFRNMGEGGNLRKNMPHNNFIRNNSFYEYSVGIHVGARMGRDTRNDVTGEGRDYAFYNTLENNYFENTVIGIKVNTEGNTIRHNEFNHVSKPIVLQCVFFALENTTINYQEGDSVDLWYVRDDYSRYAQWFRFQDDLNGGISKSEKYIEVFSDTGMPGFPDVNEGIFALNPPVINRHLILFDHRAGFPSDTARGEFSTTLPGSEIVAIWDTPMARVGDTDYYSIVIFDRMGIEINRCGLSRVKWKEVAAGYFTRESGEMEIAAVPGEPVDGKYPVCLFDRGYRVPKEIRYQDNGNPDISITTDDEHRLVVRVGNGE